MSLLRMMVPATILPDIKYNLVCVAIRLLVKYLLNSIIEKELNMRHFSSYGPVDEKQHYCVPRKKIVEKAYTQLVGHDPLSGGHYFTVWAPRQTGATWTMQQVLFKLQHQRRQPQNLRSQIQRQELQRHGNPGLYRNREPTPRSGNDAFRQSVERKGTVDWLSLDNIIRQPQFSA